MNKSFAVEQAEAAIGMAKETGIEVETFFIACYPGETEENILRTIRFSSCLPSDYLSCTLLYRLPGTELYKRPADRLMKDKWKMAVHNLLIFKSDFLRVKLQFSIYKGIVEHRLRKYKLAGLADTFEIISDIKYI